MAMDGFSLRKPRQRNLWSLVAQRPLRVRLAQQASPLRDVTSGAAHFSTWAFAHSFRSDQLSVGTLLA
jgi:hypothetical protein